MRQITQKPSISPPLPKAETEPPHCDFPRFQNMQISYPGCWEKSVLVYLFILEKEKLDKALPAISLWGKAPLPTE